MNDLSEIKKVSKSDLKSFLVQDHTSFSVLSVSCKHIESTNRIAVTLSKNSAQSFYLDKKVKSTELPITPKTKPDDCLQDAQNCSYFQFFNSKEKKLYTRFKDKVESNFEGTAAEQPLLFLTLTFNTTHDNYSAFTVKKLTEEKDNLQKDIQQKERTIISLNNSYQKLETKTKQEREYSVYPVLIYHLYIIKTFLD